MKKIICITAMCLLCSLFFALGNEFDWNQYKGFSLGGGTNVGDDLSSGFIDLGFSWYQNNSFSIRNYLKAQGSGFTNGGALGLREQLQFAAQISIHENLGIRGYGFVDFGVFLFAQGSKQFFDLPLMMEARAGGGVELLFSKGGFFVECGGGGRFSSDGIIYKHVNGLSAGMGFVSVGGRRYF